MQDKTISSQRTGPSVDLGPCHQSRFYRIASDVCGNPLPLHRITNPATTGLIPPKAFSGPPREPVSLAGRITFERLRSALRCDAGQPLDVSLVGQDDERAAFASQLGAFGESLRGHGRYGVPLQEERAVAGDIQAPVVPDEHPARRAAARRPVRRERRRVMRGVQGGVLAGRDEVPAAAFCAS